MEQALGNAVHVFLLIGQDQQFVSVFLLRFGYRMDAVPDSISQGAHAMMDACFDVQAGRAGMLRAHTINLNNHSARGQDGKMIVLVLVLNKDMAGRNVRGFAVDVTSVEMLDFEGISHAISLGIVVWLLAALNLS
jgi:hypothetical protein